MQTIGIDERRQLQDSVRRYVARSYGFDARSQAAASPEGFSRERWQEFAELGWLSVGLPEDCGGYGDALDQAALAEEFGRALAVEPWLANVALCAPLLARAPDASQRARVDALAAGRAMLALAAWEPGARYDAFEVATRAERTGDGWRLTGRKTLVLGGGAADSLLVLARESGGPREHRGLSLFLVPGDAAGVSRRALPTYDARQTADVSLEAVRIPGSGLVGAAGDAWPALEAAIDRATVMACAEAVGAMERTLEATREYLKARRQFGRALTDNQVIRHRLVDLMVAIEQSRAITEAAAVRLDDAPAARARAVSLAKAFVSPAARRVGEEGVQLHGAIGMTDEYVVGHCYKRLAAFANLFGDAQWHLERLATLDLPDPDEQVADPDEQVAEAARRPR
jgi:alkylation response protein AidB-like acyl-CoA dehydrogenase